MTDTTNIATSGGLFSAHFIDSIRQLNTNQPSCAPEWFAPPSGEPPKPRELEENIATAWELLREQWDAIRADLHGMDTTTVRRRWLLHLFDILDFNLDYQRADTVSGELRFPISHRGWKGESAPPIHTVAPTQSLDERPWGRGKRTHSPHDMLQAYLNANRKDLWGIVTNGLSLRILREVWFALYEPREERRLRLRLGAFEEVTVRAGHAWAACDLTDEFPRWMAAQEYRDSYFESPEDLTEDLLDDFAEHAAGVVISALRRPVGEDGVVAVYGVGSLFGLLRVSRLLEMISSGIWGRLLVFFPGEHDGGSYRLLDARDGWNYRAIPITAQEGEKP